MRTIIAAVCFAAMLGLLVLDRNIRAARVYRTVNQLSLAEGVNASEIQKLEIENFSGSLTVVRDGSGWKLTAPFEAQADPEAVETILFNITGARRNNEIDVRNLAEYGLAKPTIKLRLTPAGSSKPFALELGNDSTYTGQVFARFPDGTKVFTVGQHVKSSLLRGARDFRRARLLELEGDAAANMKSIMIAGIGSAVELRNDQGRWRLIAPLDAPAESSVVTEWVKTVGMLRASGYLAEQGDTQTSAAAALVALTSPTLTVSMQTAAGKVASVNLAQIDGDGDNRVWVARRPGDAEVMLVRPETISTLRQDSGYFRSRTLFDMKPEDVGQISIQVGQARTDLLRKVAGGPWEFAERPACLVDQEAINARLDVLLRTRIKQFVDANPQDLSNFGIPRMRYTVTTLDGKRSETIETGNVERGGPLSSIYAHRRGDPSVFTMEIGKDLVILPETVADRHFARFNYRKLSKLTIQLGSESHELTLDGIQWKLKRAGQAATVPADKPRVERFLLMLEALSWTRDYACSGETVIMPPSTPRVVIKAEAADGQVLLDMKVGRQAGDKSFVLLNDKRTVEVDNIELERITSAALSFVQ